MYIFALRALCIIGYCNCYSILCQFGTLISFDGSTLFTRIDELNYHSHDMFKLQTFISFFMQII